MPSYRPDRSRDSLKRSVLPRTVGDLLPEAMPQLVERLDEVRVRQAWAEVVGDDVARRSHPSHLVEGCLTVVVDNSPWLHELTLRESEILRAIQRRHSSVRTLRLSLGALPAEMRESASIGRAPLASLSREEEREIDDATAIIPDAAVAAAARRLLVRARRAAGT